MSVYFCSDLHLGHALAARLRGFDSVKEHDESIITKLNEVCGKRTMLWVLGDVAMNSKAHKAMCRVEGIKKLVRGNHDQLPTTEYLSVFAEVHGFLKYKSLWLSHCPIHPQEMYRCRGNVHGHIHKDAATPELDFPYINVNWDFWSRPVSLDEIRKIVRDHD